MARESSNPVRIYSADTEICALVKTSAAAPTDTGLVVHIATMPAGGGGGGDASAANQVIGNASLSSIDGKTPALGQALSAASSPVVLPAAQITTLTPPAAIAGFALEAGHLAAIDTATARIPPQGQALAAASTPVVLPAAQIVTLTPPAAIVGFALEAGHLATIDSHIPALGQALAAASIPVVLPVAQITTLTPPAAITGFNLEATQALIKAKTDNLDVLLSTRLKPGDTLTGVTTVAAVTAITNPLPAGTNKLGTVDIATAPAVAKGTQGANGVPTQDLKDSGRVNIMWTLEFAPISTPEVLMIMSESRDGAAVTTFTSKVITNTKRLRITSWGMAVENTLGANPKRAKLRMRLNTGGAATAASPLQANLIASVATAVNTVGIEAMQNFPDGIEYLGDGIKQIGFTIELPDWVTAAQTAKVYITIFAYEY